MNEEVSVKQLKTNRHAKIKSIIEKLQNKNYIFRFEVTYQKKNFC